MQVNTGNFNGKGTIINAYSSLNYGMGGKMRLFYVVLLFVLCISVEWT